VRAFGASTDRLLIVGDGPDAAALRRGASSNVEFRAGVTPDRVPDLLGDARALLVPSISHEGAGRVVLEAYAAGVPVLASRAGGLLEVVQDGSTGLLLPPGDTGAWTEGVTRLTDDRVTIRMGEAGWNL
jgi:glycosyltransferase involved in cell wall biosynthesis